MEVMRFITSMKLSFASGVLPLWPSAMATVQALLNKREWIYDINSTVDMGCGSGILGIAVSLITRSSQHYCVMVDFNAEAVAVAVKNAHRNGIQATGILSNVWENVPMFYTDLVICNPPFQSAGDGGPNLVDPEFKMHRQLFEGTKNRLKQNGHLIVTTCQEITGSREPEKIAEESGWTAADRCNITMPAPSARHSDKIHNYSIILFH